ncbi:MOSC N-terminal beta barrel domain-containing protein [Kitasatospora aburaviensis]
MKDTAIPVGTVGELWRYPVKSMLGERLPAADVTDRGIDGDRRHALLDPHTGRVASAKNPRLWRNLLSLTAATTADGVRITDADGTELGPEGLSAAVGRPVALVAEPRRRPPWTGPSPTRCCAAARTPKSRCTPSGCPPAPSSTTRPCTC